MKSTTTVTCILVFGCIGVGMLASALVFALAKVRHRWCTRRSDDDQGSARLSDGDKQHELVSFSNCSETSTASAAEVEEDNARLM